MIQACVQNLQYSHRAAIKIYDTSFLRTSYDTLHVDTWSFQSLWLSNVFGIYTSVSYWNSVKLLQNMYPQMFSQSTTYRYKPTIIQNHFPHKK